MASEKRKKWRERKNKSEKIARSRFLQSKRKEQEGFEARQELIAREARELGHSLELVELRQSPKLPNSSTNVSEGKTQTFNRSAWRTEHGLDK